MALDRHPFAAVPQRQDGEYGQVHLPACPPGLRLPDPQPPIKLVKRMADVESRSREIYILPLQTQQFALAEARDGKDVEDGGLFNRHNLFECGGRCPELPCCTVDPAL